MVHTWSDCECGVCMCVCVCVCLQVPIVESGALLELRKLVGQEGFHEIQCHAAGTLRNLAAVNQNKVQNMCLPKPQAIVETGCLIALPKELGDLTNVPRLSSLK